MDQYLILEFQTLDEAENCLQAIHNIAAIYWVAHGYTVLDIDGHKELVGKNAATGHDELSSTKTIAWDTVTQSPDETYYFSSLSNDERFIDGMAQLNDFNFVEKTFPVEWLV